MEFMQTAGGRFSASEMPPFRSARAQPDDVERTLARLELLAHLLDSAFVLPGINRRVGIDALIGLVPVIGDAITTAISSYIIWEARRLGVPRWLIARMAANVAFDGVVGAVPLIGDLFDAAFKANKRNVRLLRRHLERSGSVRPSVIDGMATRLD
ncbi:DUF4112 domain-containing protein [Methylobacterium nodulans]|uniref:DUF4112 domain-containing protein n=1 Tax=Methylobacterium nodulans (strain LMG 21967 / CNCM I-2342 / ORS 2060) TaxID=460265 RepID=B8IUW8_METNO|nr:DUF4112 domain-containing protein [Methylobacterium nodulans]ACL59026.1 conserved hypothetical protein [Methylobacterium nodulans ORS 2060]